jgi:hypothetical protein
MAAHGNLLNNPSAFEQFQAVEKVPAHISTGSYAAPKSLTASHAPTINVIGDAGTIEKVIEMYPHWSLRRI